jgi:hypothetical protein
MSMEPVDGLRWVLGRGPDRRRADDPMPRPVRTGGLLDEAASHGGPGNPVVGGSSPTDPPRAPTVSSPSVRRSRRASLRASVRRHRRAQGGSTMLRSIRPKRATTSLAASVDHTEARNSPTRRAHASMMCKA